MRRIALLVIVTIALIIGSGPAVAVAKGRRAGKSSGGSYKSGKSHKAGKSKTPKTHRKRK